MSEIDRLKQDIVFQVPLREHAMEFHSTWGLFSPRGIDEGSYALIREVTLGEQDVTLDLGCGYGAIGLALARDCPGGKVHLVDKDYVAVEFARKNAQVNGLTNCEAYLSNAFSEVPADVTFDNIVSNIPANVGKELLQIILQDAKSKLRDGGKLYVVTVSGLRKFMQRHFEQLFGNYDKLRQTRHCTVAMAEKR
jgi:16S rRNA (guanine1207-N2)-methyltransferase